MWNFCIVMVTPVLITGIGWKTYLIFMITLGCFVPIVYFFYPETSGLSLEEIDNLFLPADHQVNPGEYTERRLSAAGEKTGAAAEVELV